MLVATIGGLIKDYRIKKRLSQVEVSLKIGWKDTSRISKIEQGRVGKPTRETIEKVIDALVLNEQEKGNFLFVGGYLPTEEEIEKITTVISPKIDNWIYPAYLMDFSFRWLYTNIGTLQALGLPKSKKNWVKNVKPNFLEFPFLPKNQLTVEIMKGEDEKNLKSFQVAQIASFKTENEQYQNESWYKKLIQYLMKYDDFRKMWPKVDQSMYHKKLFDYEYKTMTILQSGKKKTLSFHLTTAKIINDPRFQVVLCYPADKDTAKIFEAP